MLRQVRGIRGKSAMERLIGHCTICLGLAGTAAVGLADAHDTTPWDGSYIGFNAGESSGSTCNSWALDGGTANSTNTSQVGNRDCFKTSALVGGLQIGENFQYKRFVWGVGVDLDYWSSKARNDLFNYVGRNVPLGRYSFSARDAPSAFAIIGPRIGYAANPWLAYLRLGGILSAGAHNSELFYTPTGAARPTASFSGGREFSTSGWVAGGGTELGLYGAWSLTVEYLHASLGKGSDSPETCSGSAAVCSAFLGLSLGTAHEGFSANIFRVGVTYWINFRDP
jgi:outer membrane immunogenic protein